MSLILSIGERSHRGYVRDVNEDAVVVSSPVFAVADGMGGHDSGEIASRITATILEGLGREGPYTRGGVLNALDLANRMIPQETDGDLPAGTTVVGMVLSSEGSFGFNVGDSRIYRFHRGEMTQLSTDHSVVQELIDRGSITEQEAAKHLRRNVVTRAVGVEDEIEVDVFSIEASVGDRYLLASDGLTGEVNDARISEILRSETEADSAAQIMLDEALANGGRDNISILIVDVIGSKEDSEASGTSDTNKRRGSRRSGDTTRKTRRQIPVTLGPIDSGADG